MAPRNRYLIGDVIERLRDLPDGCVHVAITSPPYYGLRSYLPNDDPNKPLEIGSEPTPDEYVQRMVEVFREVRRVLAKPARALVLDPFMGSGTVAVVAEEMGRDWSGVDLDPRNVEIFKARSLCLDQEVVEVESEDGGVEFASKQISLW